MSNTLSRKIRVSILHLLRVTILHDYFIFHGNQSTYIFQEVSERIYFVSIEISLLEFHTRHTTFLSLIGYIYMKKIFLEQF